MPPRARSVFTRDGSLPEYNRVMFDYPDILLSVALLASIISFCFVALRRLVRRAPLPRLLKGILEALLWLGLLIVILGLTTRPLAEA